MDAYWDGFAFILNNNAYIITGPNPNKKNNQLFQHELLHLFSPLFKLPNKLINLKNKGVYETQKTKKGEYIVRSLNLIYKSKVLGKNINKDIKTEEKRGFKNIAKTIKEIKSQIK